MQNIKIFLTVFFSLMLAGAGLAAAQTSSYSEEQSRQILQQIDSMVSYPENDFSAEYTITQERPGQGSSRTRAALFRRDSRDAYAIILLDPEVDRGKGYLKIGNSLHVYDPVARRFTVTSARDRFQNSNARNSDFTRSTLAQDYRITGAEQQTLGAYQTIVYDLEAITDEVSYPKMRIWVDQNNLVRKVEDYSLSGQLMRTTAIPSYQQIENLYVPITIVMIDALHGREIEGVFRNDRTVISVAKPSFQNVPDVVFTRSYLERVSQ